MVENFDCECCNTCKTWEEQIYWKHFTSIHFYMLFTPEFHDHLVLPEKFAAHLNGQLPDKVSLKGPSGVLWDIQLAKSDDLLFFGHGWKDFVKDNDLNDNCLLVFAYKRNSTFEVLIFDQMSSCEREAAYFVKKLNNTKSVHEDKKKRTAKEASSSKINEDSGEDESSLFVSKKSKKDDKGVVFSGGNVNTSTSKKCVLDMAERRRGRLRKEILPCKLLSKPKLKSGKSTRNEIVNELTLISQRDTITPESGESSPEKDHLNKSESQSKKSLNGSDAANEPSLISREHIFPENGVNFLAAADHSHKLKSRSEKQPSGNHTAIEPRQTSERDFMTIEDGEEDSSLVFSKKSKKDDEGVVFSKRKVRTSTLKKNVLNAADRRTGRLRKEIRPCKPPSKLKLQSGKTIRNEVVKDSSLISQRDTITREKDHINKPESQSRMSLNGNNTANDLNLVLREQICPENGESFRAAADHLKSLPEKQPDGNHTAIEPRQTSERNCNTTEDGESVLPVDFSSKFKPGSEDMPSGNDTSKQQSQNSGKQLIVTPEKRAVSCSHKFKGPEVEEESSGRTTAKELAQNSVPNQYIISYYRKSSHKFKGPEVEEESSGRKTAKELAQNSGPNQDTISYYRKSSHKFKGSEEELSGRTTAKELAQNSGPEDLISYYRKSSLGKDQSCESRGESGLVLKNVLPISSMKPVSKSGQSCKSSGKTGLLDKKVLPNSSKSPVSKSVSDKKSYCKEYLSLRRSVTEMEKEDALKRANHKQTENSFTAIMRPTCVYKRFFLQFPADWLQNTQLHHKQVVLRVGEKTWHATLVHYGPKSRGISTGWKKFALENNLEEFDVLVFKLVSQKDDEALVMDIDIFRVVENIVPPLPASS